MANPQGTPIWYELMTPDPDAATRFYDPLVNWKVDAQRPGDDVDYRMIKSQDENVGGVMRLSSDMAAGGAKPGWLFYVGVDDVDAMADKAKALGASVFVPPTDIPDVGRFALLADPQGAPFYIMRGATDGESRAFAPGELGHAAWNELWTTDAKAALAFYGQLFGWENRETMDMGAMGGYHFIDLGETRLGAVAGTGDQEARWNFYFHVPDIDAAVATAQAAGGHIQQGPHDVPGGSRIIIGTDPQGARFALVAPATGGAAHA